MKPVSLWDHVTVMLEPYALHIMVCLLIVSLIVLSVVLSCIAKEEKGRYKKDTKHNTLTRQKRR